MHNRQAEYESKIKGNPIKLLEMIKENSLSFDDKKKADIDIIDAIMNLMTTRQRDDEDLTDYTKHLRWQETSARRSMEGYLRSQCLPTKSPHGVTRFYQCLRLCSCGSKPQRSENHHFVMTSSWEPQCHHDIKMRTPRITGNPKFSCSGGP